MHIYIYIDVTKCTNCKQDIYIIEIIDFEMIYEINREIANVFFTNSYLRRPIPTMGFPDQITMTE